MAMAMACAVSSQTMDGQVMDHQNMDHAAHMKMMAESQRQAEVSQLVKDVMPFRPVSKIRVKTGHFDQILYWQGHASRHRLGF